MFSLQSRLDSAMGVFNKAKNKLDAVIESCDNGDDRCDVDEEIAKEEFDAVMGNVTERRSTIATVRGAASKYLENINKIIGE